MQTDEAARLSAAEDLAKEPAALPRPISAAAKRALAEAEERRRHAGEKPPKVPEIGGRDGPDPVRYGDWESKGIASDF